MVPSKGTYYFEVAWKTTIGKAGRKDGYGQFAMYANIVPVHILQGMVRRQTTCI